MDQCSSLRSLAVDQGRMKSLDDVPIFGSVLSVPINVLIQIVTGAASGM